VHIPEINFGICSYYPHGGQNPEDNMSIIQVSNLTFAYEGSPEDVFTNATFNLDTDWKLGFTGRNGRGKTTFLNLLMGKHEYSGTITASVQFCLFPSPIPDETLTALEVSREACGRDDWEIVREASLMDLPPEALDRPFCTLSGGERTKVLLASMFLTEGAFPLIDEPTNHLDLQGRKAVSLYMQKKKGFILVSHDRAFLDQTVDHILSINKQNIEIQSGIFSTFMANKTAQDNLEAQQNESLKTEIQRLTATARKVSEWSGKAEKGKFNTGDRADVDRGYVGHKAAKVMKRSKSLQDRSMDAIKEKSKLLKNIETAEDLALHPAVYHSRRIMHFSLVSVSYGDHKVFSDLGFEIARGDRIALTGKNGSGKTTALKLALGEDIPYEGLVERPAGLIVSHVPQDFGFLKGSLLDFARESGIAETLFLAILRKLDFSRSQFDAPMEAASDGQKKKILLAKSLCESAHLYVWDEPLNFVDVYSRIQIEELLVKFKPTLLFVEHDAAFCEKVATKTVSL
jgi:lincosamide and streptogramin A transport system ATP-binding/permease protein